jgi:hypothetical protein
MDLASAIIGRAQTVSLPIVMSREINMKTRLACLLVAVATLILPDLAHACGSGAVQFADDFRNPDAGWSYNDHGKISGGAITLMPVVNGGSAAYNTAYIFRDADVCVQIKPTDFTKPEQLNAGLIFWITDTHNFYTFCISPNGHWDIQRLAGSRWILISSGSSDAIKKGVGDLNEVEVRLAGNTGTGYVNGTKVVAFNGQPPEGGGYFGINAESEKERTNIWEFHDFKILKPQ